MTKAYIVTGPTAGIGRHTAIAVIGQPPAHLLPPLVWVSAGQGLPPKPGASLRHQQIGPFRSSK